MKKSLKNKINKVKHLLIEAWLYCDEEDKSTEFMFQYMSDISGLEYDEVVEYFTSRQSSRDREEYIKNLNKKL